MTGSLSASTVSSIAVRAPARRSLDCSESLSGTSLDNAWARADVSAVIHTHQTFASALSILNEPIPPLFDEVTLAIGNTIDVVPYALSGTRELHDNVARKLANRCHCYILQNHGTLCIGTDLDKTLGEIEKLLQTGDGVLWLTDRKGRRVAVPVAKVAYVEVGAPASDRKVGFGAP